MKVRLGMLLLSSAMRQGVPHVHRAQAAIGRAARAFSNGDGPSAPTIKVDGERVELSHFVAQGPIIKACIGSDAAGAIDAKAWEARGALLMADIGIGQVDADGGQRLSQAEAVRVYQYYLPLYEWISGQISGRGTGRGPLFVGVSCPQGGGKTTLVDSLVGLFADQGLSCAAMSLDDFYLTHADQLAVKESNSGNRLLELRGNPGTHDMSLALRTVESLRDGESHDEHAIPRYDKSCFGGKGDRFPADQWSRLVGTPDVVLFEAWCFGFSAVDESELTDRDLIPINALLDEGGDYAKLHAMMGAWIVIQIESPKVVYRWREQAEVALRENGRGGMSETELTDFVSRYMPAYAHYLPGLYADSAGYSPLYIQIDDNRNPLQMK